MAEREQKERKAYGAPGVLERTTHRLLLNIGVILFRSQCCSSASPYHIHPHDHAPIVILINSTAVTPQKLFIVQSCSSTINFMEPVCLAYWQNFFRVLC